MNKPYFHQIYEPQLENPIFVEGLSGLGNIGMIAARHLIETTGAKIFAELYSPYFPDYVIINKDGTCRPPRYVFYEAKTKTNHYIILTGDAQPPMEDSLAHYDLADMILDFVEKYQTRFIFTMGGVAASKSGNEVYIAATSIKLAQKHKEKGTIIYGEGKIIGATGLLLGLAKERRWKGVCLLGATTGFGAERGVALTVYKAMAKIIETETKKEAEREKKVKK
ncbi:PAC2 family protein [Candidatus Bathyarchaeota archaeon]|nr:PAC2 family protein [Candidatus Bathyarchaeota archaeon]